MVETACNLELKKEAEERLKVETERNFQLNKNAEERLKLEAAISFELFKTAADSCILNDRGYRGLVCSYQTRSVGLRLAVIEATMATGGH